MVDLADAAVHGGRRPLHDAAKGVADALVTQAYPQDGPLFLPDQLSADAEVGGPFRSAGAGGKNDIVVVQPLKLIPRQLVVAHDQRFAPIHRSQQMENVVGERVVVIDDQRPHRSRPFSITASIAANPAVPFMPVLEADGTVQIEDAQRLLTRRAIRYPKSHDLRCAQRW